MLGLSNKLLAALLLGSMIATPTLAATPYTGCPAGYHRAESEGGGVATVNQATRKAESEGGGVATDAAMAATLYPTDIRATGVNWAHGVARVFSVVGPYLGGVLLAREWPMRDILYLFAVLPFAAGACIFVLGAVARARASAHDEMGAPSMTIKTA